MIVTEREGTLSVNKKFVVHYSAAFFMFRFLYFNAAFLIDCFYLDVANKSLITTVSGRKKFNCFLSKKITYPIKCPVQTPYLI